MGKEKKTKIKRKLYDRSDMEKAINLVQKGESVTAASRICNVPYATLHSRIMGKYSLDEKPGPKTYLTSEEENELVNWITMMSSKGFPVTKNHLFDTVQMFVRGTKKVTPFTNCRPSKHWYASFLNRHPKLSERMCQNISTARANVSELKIRQWFGEVGAFLLSHNLQNIGPDRIFNIDESGFLLCAKSNKVLVKKSEKAVYNECGSDQECCTALIGGNAAGQLLPTMVIFNNRRISATIAKNFPAEFILGKSDSGWMTSELFYSYVAHHLYPWCLRNDIKFPIILYIDGRSAHLTKALSDFCFSKNIELIALLANATHIMQPIDVTLLHPLQKSYNEAITKWKINNYSEQLTKTNFAAVLNDAFQSIDIKTIFKSGFERCGLYPFSRGSVDYSKLLKVNEDKVQDKHQQNEQNNNLFNSNSSLKPIDVIESQLNAEVLEKFRNNNGSEWAGAIEYKELYKLWYHCTGKNQDSTVQNEPNEKVISENSIKLEEPLLMEKVPDDNYVILYEGEATADNSNHSLVFNGEDTSDRTLLNKQSSDLSPGLNIKITQTSNENHETETDRSLNDNTMINSTEIFKEKKMNMNNSKDSKIPEQVLFSINTKIYKKFVIKKRGKNEFILSFHN